MSKMRASTTFCRATLILVAAGCVFAAGCSKALNYKVAALTDEKRAAVTNALTAEQLKKLDDWVARHSVGGQGVPPGVSVSQALIDEDAWLTRQRVEAAKTEERRKKLQAERVAKQEEFSRMLSVTLLSKKNRVRVDEQRYVALDIACDNKTDKAIRRVEGVLRLIDIYGNKIIDVNWSYGGGISAKQSVVDHATVVSISQSSDPQVVLWGTDFDKIKSTFEINAVVFNDGTSLKDPDVGV